MHAPTNAQLVEHLREHMDDSLVFILNKEPGNKNQVLVPAGTYLDDQGNIMIHVYQADGEYPTDDEHVRHEDA